MTTAIAGELASRLLAIDGVERVFPPRGGVIRVLVAAARPTQDPAVQVEDDGPLLRVSARLGTSRTIPSRVVIDHAVSAVRDVVGLRPCLVDIELARID